MAQSEQTSSGLAVIYDELIRQYWEEMSGKLRSFNLSAEVGAIQPLFLERARQLQRKFQGNNCLLCTFSAQVPCSHMLGAERAWNNKRKDEDNVSAQAARKRTRRTNAASGSRDLSKVRCFKCKELGHISKNCPLAAGNRRNPRVPTEPPAPRTEPPRTER